ncbi:UDP-N-acetylmuramate--L-alanine ligase [Buchnera aphidicola]|uniref:UDP-N-acetylmuramate--L-alanine ligase n=1 Tax=Buchnera aphidicola TaxID=9 RepID=UPI003463ACBA
MKINNIKKNNFFEEKKYKKIHLIGIAGSGMSGIAFILLKLGYVVSGSDLLKNLMTKKLKKMGANIFFQHSKDNIKNIDFIVKSSAIAPDNPELIEGKKKNIPIFLRAEMLQILMQYKFGIAVSGTHGKTTTTAMIFDILKNNALDPTVINGGLIKSINSCAKLGSSNYFLVEADESDSSFLYLNPKIAITTNIESDHIDYYNGNFTLLKKTFLKFLNQIPSNGIAIVCTDNSSIRDILPKIKCQIITYGFNKNADIRITCYKQEGFISYFKLIRKKQLNNLNITLNIPGKHNALNAAAAISFAMYQKIPDEKIYQSLKKFQGTVRRFEYVGNLFIKKSNSITNKSAILIDDYGHHPTELFENIKTIRTSWPKKNLIMIFQPHRYTRTYHLYYDFIKVLSQVDSLLILKVYSANEKYITGYDSLALYNDIKKIKKMNISLVNNNKLILKFLIPYLNGNDIILIQGAGNIDTIMNKTFILKNKKVVI